MTIQIPPYGLILLFSAAISAVVAIRAWHRRPVAGARSLFWLMLGATLWSLAYALELGSPELAGKRFFIKIEFLGVCTVPLAWLSLVLEFTGRDGNLSLRHWMGILLVPVVTLGLVWTDEWHGLIYSQMALDTSGPYPMLEADYGPWFWVAATYSYVLLLVGTLLLVRAFQRASGLIRAQIRALLISAALPWLGNFVYLSGLSPLPQLDLTPFAFALTGMVSGLALFSYRLLDVVPVARDVVFDSMRDGVMVLDAGSRIVDFNPAAMRLLGSSGRTLMGQPAIALHADWSELLGASRHAAEVRQEIEVGSGPERRTLDLRMVPLTDARGRFSGRLMVLRDISEQKKAEKALGESTGLLRTRHERERILGEITQKLNAAQEVQEVVEIILQSVDDLGYKHCSSWEKRGDRLYWNMYRPGLPNWLSESVRKLALSTGLRTAEAISVPLDSDCFYARAFREGQSFDAREPRELIEALSVGDAAISDMPAFAVRAGIELIERLGIVENSAYPIRGYGVLVLANAGEAKPAEHREWLSIVLKQAETAIARIRAVEALQASEARYRALLEHATDAIILTNREDEILGANQHACELLGYSREELLRMRVTDLQAPEVRVAPGRAVKRELALFEGKPFESLDVHQDGRRIPVEITVSPIEDPEGELVLSIVRDITERKRAEEEAREREDFLRLLNEITGAALGTPDLSAMAQILADRLGELFHADGCYITLWDEETQLVRPLAAYGAARDTYRLARVVPGEQTMTAAVLQAGGPVVAEDVHDTPCLSRRIAELFPDRSLLGLPLRLDEKLAGAALIAFNDLHQFSPEEVARGKQVAEHIALALAKAHLLETESAARERTEALYQVARSLIAPEELSRRLQVVVDTVARVLPADRATLILLSQQTERVLEFVQGGPGQDRVVEVPLEELEEGLTGWVLRERQPALSPKGGPDPRESEAVRARRSATDCGSILVVPLAYGEDLLGTLTAIRRPDEPDFGQDDLELMSTMAYQTAIGIANARLMEGLEAQVAARTAEIEAEKEKSEAILRSVGEAIAMLDLEGNIQYVNQAFTELTGYSAGEVKGRHLQVLVAEGLPGLLMEARRAIVDRGGDWRKELEIRRKDGRTYVADLNVAPVRDERGELLGFVSSHRDISQQRELERARSGFMSNVSHQLRTPITTMSLYTHLLSTGQAPPEKAPRYLEVLNRQTQRLKDLIQDILHMAELDSGLGMENWEPVRLPGLLRDIVAGYQDRIEEAGLILELVPVPGDLPEVMGDRMRLAQALRELLDNAITFCPEGGRLALEVAAAAAEGRPWVKVAVSDTGVGISPEEQALIFDRFYRGNPTEGGDIPGTGLGLCIAQEIARAHGGRLTVESALDQGSRFTLWLPAGNGPAGPGG